MLNIPLDIERICVEVAISDFVLDCPTFPKKLKLPTVLWACRRFKAWCYPHLYRSIAFNLDNVSTGLSLLRRTLVESPELALLVQELTLPHRFTIDDIVEILPLCLNLVSLLSWDDGAPSLDISNNKALRRLSCFPTLLTFTLGGPPPQSFIQLTHLDLIITEGSAWYPLLAGLTNLTHLCTDLPPVGSDIPSLIEHFPPSLCVCVVFEEGPHGDDLSRKKPIASGELDQRIVFSSSERIELSVPYIFRQADDFWSDWARFGSGQTYWDEAELIIKNRSLATNQRR